MAIHVIQSQRIDVLLDSMLRIVNQSAKIPWPCYSRGILLCRHLQSRPGSLKNCREKGISANTQFHHRIRAFQWASYQWVLNNPKEVEQVREANIPRIIIKWRVFQALRKCILPEQILLEIDHPLYSIIKRIYDSADRLEQGTEKQLKNRACCIGYPNRSRACLAIIWIIVVIARGIARHRNVVVPPTGWRPGGRISRSILSR